MGRQLPGKSTLRTVQELHWQFTSEVYCYVLHWELLVTVMPFFGRTLCDQSWLTFSDLPSSCMCIWLLASYYALLLNVYDLVTYDL